MKSATNDFPQGWDEERVCDVIRHYESQTEDEAVAEDEAAFENPARAVMTIPNELVPAVRSLLFESDEPSSDSTVS